MKTHRSTLIVILALFLSASCATTPTGRAYQTIGSVKIAVDTGMQWYADQVIDGKVSQAQQDQVRKAFGEYTRAAAAAAAVMRASTDPAPPDLANAATALLNLLSAFGYSGGK